MLYLVVVSNAQRKTMAASHRLLLYLIVIEIPKNYSLKAALFGENVEGKSLPVSVLGILSAIPRGLGNSAILVFYVFIIGGCANYWMRIDRNECLFYWSFNNGSKNCRHVR